MKVYGGGNDGLGATIRMGGRIPNRREEKSLNRVYTSGESFIGNYHEKAKVRERFVSREGVSRYRSGRALA